MCHSCICKNDTLIIYQYMPLIALLSSVFVTAIAQLLMKVGARTVEPPHLFTLSEIARALASVFSNPWCVVGICIYIASAVNWIFVLKNIEVGTAYPFFALGSVFVLTFGIIFLGESANMYKFLGMFLVVVGLFVLSKSYSI